MQLSFVGGSREVGRSSMLVESNGKRTLLDCGVKINGNEEEFPQFTPREVHSISQAILSHAHLDHSGYFPGLYAMGFRKKLFLTKPTRDLIQLLYADYLRLAKERGTRPFGDKDIERTLASTECLEYEDEAAFRKTGIKFHQAGHILGSAMTELALEQGRKLLYTGDLNIRETRLLDGATMGLRADYLIIESTYGGKEDRHLSSKANAQNFVTLVKDSLDKGGKVLVPSFAIGRGQEVLFTLENFMRSGALPTVPIYLDGMVKKALRIYRHNAIYLKQEIQRRILTSDDDPFKSEHYKVPLSKDRSDVINGGPCIVVATSGMLNGGPALTYLKAFAGNTDNALVLVGYQGQGTTGRKLIEGERSVQIGSEHYDVRMKVSLAPMSAHSDHDELVKFARSMEGLRKVFVVHGEGSKSDELAADIERQCNRNKPHAQRISAVVPDIGEIIQL